MGFGATTDGAPATGTVSGTSETAVGGACGLDGAAATISDFEGGFAAFGSATLAGVVLAGLAALGGAALAGFAFAATGFCAAGFTGAAAFFFAGGAAAAPLEVGVLLTVPLPAAARDAAGFAPEALRMAFATGLGAGFAARFGAVLGVPRRPVAAAFGLATGLRDVFAVGLVGRTALAAGFAVFFATAVRAGFAVRLLVRPLFDWAVAFITLPAVRAPGIPRPWVCVAETGVAPSGSLANPAKPDRTDSQAPDDFRGPGPFPIPFQI